MKKIFLFLSLFITCYGYTQSFRSAEKPDTNQWVRAFPITDYVVDLNDSLKVVQVYLPHGPKLKEKQPALVRGIYKGQNADTSIMGSGRCHLIKGDYYYFTVNSKGKIRQPQKDDLLYTVIEKPSVYRGQLLRIASHYIELQNVYDQPLFDREAIFTNWSLDDELSTIDSMIHDIRYTGDYFTKNSPSINMRITGGKYKGKMVLGIMKQCVAKDVADFLNYILARPRLYAGHRWKVSEIFATWLRSGAPTLR